MLRSANLSAVTSLIPSGVSWRRFAPLGAWVGVSIIGAYAVAAVVSAILMSFMMKSAIKPQTRAASAGPSVQLNLGRQPNYRDIRKSIMDRNVFNSEGKFPDETSGENREGEGGMAVFDLNAPCQRSTLNIELLGTIYMGDSAQSFATVKEQGYPEADVYRVGDGIIGNEEVVVAAIERKKLILNNKGVKECLELAGDKLPVANDGFPTAPGAGSDPGGAPAPEAGAGGCGGTVQLDGPYVESELGTGLAKIINAARMVPNTIDNQVNGFKIFSINQGTILGRIGFQNGDVITQVNDTSLKLPDQGFALYQALQDEREIRINLLRGSNPCTINVRIK